jgi:pyruvate dehydrogenase E1 component alpha subunit
MVNPQLGGAERLSDLGILADPSEHTGMVRVEPQQKQQTMAVLRRMMVIRAAEEIIADNVKSGLIKCPCHLAIGQEACAVGVALNLDSGDRVFGAHRSHGHYLALGGSLVGLFAEVLGRDSGVSHGMGGSMHLVDRRIGLYGTVPIVGATIPVAVGAALAAKLDGQGAVAVSFFGDGATEEGSFHESLNMAAAMRLPVLFVCENNLFSSHLHVTLRQPSSSTKRFADAQGLPARVLDGNDVAAVASAAADLLRHVRAGEGPGFLELVTYRWRGHVGWRDDEDVGVSRNVDLPAWRRRDPIARLIAGLVAQGLVQSREIDDLSLEIAAEVRAAWNAAVSAPYPPSDALFNRVYAQDMERQDATPGAQ